MKYYKGKYKVKNPAKYRGDHNDVVYRSHWERQLCRWLDSNSNVVWWNSECLVIPYRCATDRKMHRYFIDFQVKFKGKKLKAIEVKPECQTLQPVKKKGGREKRFLTESLTYAKNSSKWTAAGKYCRARDMKFEIWTERHLQALGIRLLIKK